MNGSGKALCKRYAVFVRRLDDSTSSLEMPEKESVRKGGVFAKSARVPRSDLKTRVSRRLEVKIRGVLIDRQISPA